MSKKTMNFNVLQLRDQLQEKEEQFGGKIDILGMTAMTNPGKVSSSRNIMFTSHLNQRVNLNKSEFPLLMTGIEKDVGKHSTGYYATKNELEVVAIVPKFEAIDNPTNMYSIFLYDKKNDKYDVIEKKMYEELTERYGYSYDTSTLDSKKVGDQIGKGEVLYKTTGYDSEMNYGYGINAKYCYLASMGTIEDAILVSESLSERMKSKEMETVKISINDNDILVNLYGDNDTHQGFPNIGERVKDNIVCAKRRIHNNQILYDLRNDNLKRINTVSDSPYFYDGEVYDIKIYSNKNADEIPDNKFNRQFKQYLEMQSTYCEKVMEVCENIYETGSECSSDIHYMYKRAKDILEPDTKWQDDKGRTFSNIVLEISIQRDVGISIGQKIAG